MKYANRLTDEELREVYGLFIDSDGKINELNITRDERSIGLEGYVEIPEIEEERLKEDPNATIILMMIMKLQIMMSKYITIQVIVRQIIENGCITNLVMNMQEITYLMTKKFKFQKWNGEYSYEK